MLRLRSKRPTEELPYLHNPEYTLATNTLHSLGQELSFRGDLRHQ
jgi:hypothetical protein